MQLAATMAQFLNLISLGFLLFLAKTFIQTADSQTEEQTTPTTTYDEWYQSGMDSYNKENWEDTIFYLEKALEEFKFYRSRLVECRLKCRNSTRPSRVSDEGTVVEEMQYFQGLFMKANCVRKCKFEKLGNRPQVIDNDVTDKFLSRMPYSYLQFAYYKSFEYEKAVAAAYTYVQWHQDDDVMHNNLDYYRNLHGITEEHQVDLEEQLHHKYFMEGYRAYEKGDFARVIESINKALEEYWMVDEECRALCEGKYENREFMDLYEAMSNHYASVLYCKSQCEEWNSRLKGSIVENYLPNHYHYLQFAYHKEGNWVEAVNAAASFLVLVPNDPTMTTNMEYYEAEEAISKDAIKPTREAEFYQRRKDLEAKMLQFAKMRFWGEEELEYLEEMYQGSPNAMLYRDQAEPINPDEVRLEAQILAALQSGQSFADVQGDDPPEVMTQPEEVWAEYVDEDDEEVDVEHFPENYFGKPEEIWPDDEFVVIEDGDEEDGPDRQYSPEPGVSYGTDDAIIDVHKSTSDSTDMTEETLLDAKEQQSQLGKDKSQDRTSEKRTSKKPTDSEKEGLKSSKDDFVDPDLDYRVDDNGVKWPEIKDDDKPPLQTGSKVSQDEDDADKTSKESLSQTQRGAKTNSQNEPNNDEMEGVSALDSLKKSLIYDNLFPSGPLRAGPSIHGRRYVSELEVDSDVEEPSYVPSLDGVRLYMNGAMLNGTNRMAADNISTQMECDNLIKLMKIESKMGDGYNGKVYPHTKYESFEGMTVSVAVKAAKVGRVPLVLPATYLHLAEKSRIFMKKYFTIKKELYFSYSHLVCRTAEPDSKETRTDLSHPIHADNCQLDEHHVCHKTSPAFTWRDWSAVLYLNDDFAGGDFVFAHPNFTYQSQLRPKCGRLVGFSAGEENLHGVKAVLSGRRCALALWFTEDPRYQEQEFNKAVVMFRETWEEQEMMKKKNKSTFKTEL